MNRYLHPFSFKTPSNSAELSKNDAQWCKIRVALI